MSIGIGGSSIISRALGAKEAPKALKTFGNQITMTILLTVVLVFFGLYYIDGIIPTFGGKGAIFEPAKTYYRIVLYGVPFLALSMMGNTVIRAEGKPKFGMYAMMIPSISNLLLDVLFINVMDLGMMGAAWATTGSYVLCFAFIFYFFIVYYCMQVLHIVYPNGFSLIFQDSLPSTVLAASTRSNFISSSIELSK